MDPLISWRTACFNSRARSQASAQRRFCASGGAAVQLRFEADRAPAVRTTCLAACGGAAAQTCSLDSGARFPMLSCAACNTFKPKSGVPCAPLR